MKGLITFHLGKSIKQKQTDDQKEIHCFALSAWVCCSCVGGARPLYISVSRGPVSHNLSMAVGYSHLQIADIY